MKLILSIIGIVICFSVHRLLGTLALALVTLWLVLSYFPSVLAILGNSKFSEGDIKKALKLYKKAASWGTASEKIKTTYGVLLLRSGEPEKATEIFNKVVLNGSAKKEERLYAKQYRCMSYYKSGRLDDAIEDAKEVYEVVKSTQIYSILGFLMTVSKEKPEDILAFCEEAYEFNSDDRDIIDNLVVALTNTGELERARDLAEELTKQQPQFVEGFYHLALIYKKMGDIENMKKAALGLKETKRSYMTTVSEEEVERIIREAENA